jgi:membrane fusion protein (multidrug efflux system)
VRFDRNLGEQTKVSRSQYDAAKAAIGQSEASVKDAQLQLSYTNITAPPPDKSAANPLKSGSGCSRELR